MRGQVTYKHNKLENPSSRVAHQHQMHKTSKGVFVKVYFWPCGTIGRASMRFIYFLFFIFFFGCCSCLFFLLMQLIFFLCSAGPYLRANFKQWAMTYAQPALENGIPTHEDTAAQKNPKFSASKITKIDFLHWIWKNTTLITIRDGTKYWRRIALLVGCFVFKERRVVVFFRNIVRFHVYIRTTIAALWIIGKCATRSKALFGHI